MRLIFKNSVLRVSKKKSRISLSLSIAAFRKVAVTFWCMFPSLFDNIESGLNPRLSTSSDFDDNNFGSLFAGNKSIDMTSSQVDFSSKNLDDVETEMRRLRLELKQTMDMYSTACKEALTAKQKVLVAKIEPWPSLKVRVWYLHQS